MIQFNVNLYEIVIFFFLPETSRARCYSVTGGVMDCVRFLGHRVTGWYVVCGQGVTGWYVVPCERCIPFPWSASLAQGVTRWYVALCPFPGSASVAQGVTGWYVALCPFPGKASVAQGVQLLRFVVLYVYRIHKAYGLWLMDRRRQVEEII